MSMGGFKLASEIAGERAIERLKEIENQKVYSFHKDYWKWSEDERGYLIVEKK